jgi:hypothetical protein
VIGDGAEDSVGGVRRRWECHWLIQLWFSVSGDGWHPELGIWWLLGGGDQRDLVVVGGFLIAGHIEVVGVVAGSDGGTALIMVVQRRPVGSEGRVPRRKREVELGSEVRQRTKQDDIRASIGRRKKDTWPLLEVVARSGYASRDNQTHGVSFHRDHESKAERRIARRTHHDACVASGSVPPTTDLHHLLPYRNTKTGGGESAAEATVTAET